MILNGHVVTDSRSKLIPSPRRQRRVTRTPDNLLKSSATIGTDGIVLISHWNDLPDGTVTARTPETFSSRVPWKYSSANLGGRGRGKPSSPHHPLLARAASTYRSTCSGRVTIWLTTWGWPLIGRGKNLRKSEWQQLLVTNASGFSGKTNKQTKQTERNRSQHLYFQNHRNFRIIQVPSDLYTLTEKKGGGGVC